MSAAGYSGTPLAKKLGLKAGMRVCAVGAPTDYRALAVPWPEGAQLHPRPDASTALVHLFVTEAGELGRQLQRLRKILASDAVLWISWPKKASRRPTDITEDTIRELALPLGWVDVKVCAVDEVWSGLKLVVRQALR
ncbi:MAG TPA: DUF3052 domain-containing protein [Albitalea sp.]|uniref:DUF3052 domain-containing protein n=1 Tax=Piscinibacter sp. TaxID=1903157 RepID=UPI002ED0FEEE